MTLSDSDKQKLIRAAFEAKAHSYSPYSKFPVGAALLGSDGQMIKGANIENASYGGTICAERTAVVKAVSEGVRQFVGLAVTTNVPESISPCGMCRQFLREFFALNTPILLVPGDYNAETGTSGKHSVRETTMGDLLPDSFGPEHLELPRKAD